MEKRAGRAAEAGVSDGWMEKGGRQLQQRGKRRRKPGIPVPNHSTSVIFPLSYNKTACTGRALILVELQLVFAQL